MNTDLQEELYKKYPHLFEQLIASHRGIECDDGWYNLIDSLCQCILVHYKYPPIEFLSPLYKKLYNYLTISIKNGLYWIAHKIANENPNATYCWSIEEYNKRPVLTRMLSRFSNAIPLWDYEYKVVPITSLKILQIKEKFGGLRFYYQGGDDTVVGMVIVTRNLSHKTCEVCGKSATLCDKDGWKKTICSDCVKLDKYKGFEKA